MAKPSLCTPGEPFLCLNTEDPIDWYRCESQCSRCEQVSDDRKRVAAIPYVKRYGENDVKS